MAKGGARPGAGRKAKPKLPIAEKKQAESVLSKLGTVIEFPSADGGKRTQKLPTEDELWITMLVAQDMRIRLDALKYLTNRRDGEPVHIVNHLHDKPIEVNHTFSIAQELREARERATKP